MIYNTDFLTTLDKQKNKNIYARVIALNLQDYPIESFEGSITQGSINIDGSSAVRRTCSLTIVTNNFNRFNYDWSLRTKFKLEIGVRNTISAQYDDIIWFNQGIYFISSFSMSQATNNFTISIQGKDKMSMLNGDFGGIINLQVDFGTIDEPDGNGNWIINKITINEIIQNLVHQYGGEMLHNIIINDLPEYGLELLEYRYDKPMYLYKTEKDENGETNIVYDNITLNDITKYNIDGELKSLSELDASYFSSLVNPLVGSNTPKPITINNEPYIFAKVEYGQTAGYRQTSLVYAGDLIANAGDTIVSVLDKIKNMLGEFEYFYDLDGRFIFQKKASFTGTITDFSAPFIENDQTNISTPFAYKFNDGSLIVSYNVNPNIANVKNDYTICGQQTTVSGTEIPIYLRCAIDTKPVKYKSLNGNTYISGSSYSDSESENKIICDWREIIYQMAVDYYQEGHHDDFEVKISKANSSLGLYPFGTTGYEQYYENLYSNWRNLYNPNIADNNVNYFSKNETQSQKRCWNKSVWEYPEQLKFWFDFLDNDSQLEQFNVKLIGQRPIVFSDTNIKALYFKNTPSVFFINDIQEIEETEGYTYIQAPDALNMFTISSQGIAAKDKLDELVYKHGYKSESITINCIPIYYLEPNTKVYLSNEEVGIDGIYIIDKITIPFSHSGTMSLTLTSAPHEYAQSL